MSFERLSTMLKMQEMGIDQELEKLKAMKKQFNETLGMKESQLKMQKNETSQNRSSIDFETKKNTLKGEFIKSLLAGGTAIQQPTGPILPPVESEARGMPIIDGIDA